MDGEGAGGLFAGLLQGFGATLLDRQQQRHEQNLKSQTQLLTLYAKAIESGDIDAEVGIPLLSQIMSGSMEDTGLFAGSVFGKKGKGKGSPLLDLLKDPEQLSGMLSGFHQGIQGVGQGGQAAPEAAQTPAIPTGGGQAQPPLGSPASMIPEPDSDEHEQQVGPEPMTTVPVAGTDEQEKQFAEVPTRTVTPPAQPAAGQAAAPPTIPAQPSFIPWQPPPQPARRSLFVSREEKERRKNEAIRSGEIARQEGGLEGQIKQAQRLIRDYGMSREEAFTRVGLGLTARGQSTRPINAGIIRDPKDGKWYQQWMDPIDGSIDRNEVAAPIERSPGTPNKFEAKTGELATRLGLDPNADPRVLYRDLQPMQRETIRQAVELDDANQVARETSARIAADIQANKARPLGVEDLRALQLRYGTTAAEAEQIAGIPLTPQGAQAAAASYAFERKTKEARILFEKIWPKETQPELRRGALALLQRNQDPNFIELQSKLEAMSLELAVIVQGSRPSDTDRQVFQAAFPNTRSDNWSLIQVPTSYEAGLRLLTAAENIATSARKDLGIVSAAERERRQQPSQPSSPEQKVVPGITRDKAGNFVTVPQK